MNTSSFVDSLLCRFPPPLTFSNRAWTFFLTFAGVITASFPHLEPFFAPKEEGRLILGWSLDLGGDCFGSGILRARVGLL